MPRDAVIVSTARTPIGRAYKGAFNATSGPTLGSLSLKPAIERSDAGIRASFIFIVFIFPFRSSRRYAEVTSTPASRLMQRRPAD